MPEPCGLLACERHCPFDQADTCPHRMGTAPSARETWELTPLEIGLHTEFRRDGTRRRPDNPIDKLAAGLAVADAANRKLALWVAAGDADDSAEDSKLGRLNRAIAWAKREGR